MHLYSNTLYNYNLLFIVFIAQAVGKTRYSEKTKCLLQSEDRLRAVTFDLLVILSAGSLYRDYLE